MPVMVHAFEMLAGNARLLSLLFDRFAIPGTVHTMALSNITGRVHRPLFARTGQENAMASFTPNRGTEPIATTTVVEFAREHSLKKVDWLMLDAEGWDGHIIDGTMPLLRERRVTILEFEYNPSAMNSAWPKGSHLTIANSTSLHFKLLAQLQSHGYECLWQGPAASDQTAKLSSHSHLAGCSHIDHVGNLVCAASEPILAKLRSLDFEVDRSTRARAEQGAAVTGKGAGEADARRDR